MHGKDALHPAMTATRWTLGEALAWIATRQPEAIKGNDGAADLCVWMALNPAHQPYPYPEPSEAWVALSEAMALGLHGLGTSVRMFWNGGPVQHTVGVPFPPKEQLGAALDYGVYSERPSIIRPIEALGAHSWVEIHDLSFWRADIMAWFPALSMPVSRAEIVGDAGRGTDARPLRAGRRRGAPSLANADEDALSRMRLLFVSGGDMNVTKAASIVVAEGGVAGDGTDESKAKRLERRYRSAFPAGPIG
ncbi:hypothetical protein [Aureimonas flava]|uniref:hypothetical protein n=1 Tax=Aureimonas flava TaxID=2320271 RepID=UPI0010A9699E|nr:hypothetical protein [Aureimonas flava]